MDIHVHCDRGYSPLYGLSELATNIKKTGKTRFFNIYLDGYNIVISGNGIAT